MGDKSKEKPDPMLSFRCPEDITESVMELRPLLKRLPEYQAVTLSRSALMRIALVHGTQRLRELLAKRLETPQQIDLLGPHPDETDVDDV